MGTLSDFSRIVADTVSAMGHSEFSRVLSDGVQKLMSADDISLIRYYQSGAPTIEYTGVPKRRGKTTLNRYVKGPFLLDPFYRAASVHRQYGVFKLSTLAPTGFKESEYFRTWYHNCGFTDECGMLIKLDDGFVNLALGMTDSGRRFTKRHIDRLRVIFPAIEALIRQHWAAVPPATAKSDLRNRLHSALGAFGSSVLTRREQQVIELILLGHSTRLVAEKLGISAETAKLHRKHAYAKLDISSQAELFYLFVDALASHTGASGEDPLLSYH